MPEINIKAKLKKTVQNQASTNFKGKLFCAPLVCYSYLICPQTDMNISSRIHTNWIYCQAVFWQDRNLADKGQLGSYVLLKIYLSQSLFVKQK